MPTTFPTTSPEHTRQQNTLPNTYTYTDVLLVPTPFISLVPSVRARWPHTSVYRTITVLLYAPSSLLDLARLTAQAA